MTRAGAIGYTPLPDGWDKSDVLDPVVFGELFEAAANIIREPRTWHLASLHWPRLGLSWWAQSRLTTRTTGRMMKDLWTSLRIPLVTVCRRESDQGVLQLPALLAAPRNRQHRLAVVA